MSKIDYLPLGSIVILKGGVKKLMIISRGLVVKLNDEEQFFDYGGVHYPEGLMGEQIAYFNHDGVIKIVYNGYSDDDDKMMVGAINEFRDIKGIKKGDPYELNKNREKK